MYDLNKMAKSRKTYDRTKLCFEVTFSLTSPLQILRSLIDHFQNWRRICYSFVFMLIRPTGLTFGLNIPGLCFAHGSEIKKAH